MPKISQLPVATQVNSPDLFAIVQAGVTKQATASLVITATQTGIIISESQVTNLVSDLAARLLKANNLSDVDSASTSRVNLGLPLLTNGQLWIGSTGLDPVNTTLTAGTNISISNAAGSITISATGSGGFTWTHVTGTSQVMDANNGYIADNVGLVTLSLPATSSIGNEIEIIGKGSGGWTISQATGQQIFLGTANSTLGPGGSISSTNDRDSLYMICTVADTEWTIESLIGNLTVV